MAITFVFNPFTGTFDEINSLTLAAVGSSPNANAASIVAASQVLTLQPADATHPGVVTSGTQTFGGVKSFTTPTLLSDNTALNHTLNYPFSSTGYETWTWNVGSNSISFKNAGLGGYTMYADNSMGISFGGALTLNSSTEVHQIANGKIGLTVIQTGISPGDLSQWVDSGSAILLKITSTGVLNFPQLTASTLLALDGSKNTVSQAVGNLTDAGTDGIVVTGGTGAVIGSGTSLAQHVADTTHNGYLASTDWNTFNGKQAAGNYITALTGDATASGPGSAALTLATVNGNVGSFGSSTSIPSITVNGKGLVTAASGNAVIAPAGTLTGTTLASNVVTSSLTTVGTIGTGVWQGSVVASTYLGLSRTINAQSGTTYTFVLGDGSGAGGNPLVTFSNGSATTVTVPTNASVAFPTGTQIDVIQIGAGKVTIAAAGGVTINSKGGNLAISAQYVGVSLVKTGTNQWYLLGDLIA